MGICCLTQETQTGALYQPRGVGWGGRWERFKREGIYLYTYGNWCFWTVVLEKTLESPLDSKEIQPVHPKVHPVCSLEGLMLKLKLQYFGHLMWRADSFEKTLMLGKIEGRMTRDDGGWDGWMTSPTQWTWVWVGSRSWWWTGRPGVLRFTGLQRARNDWATELNWWLIHIEVWQKTVKFCKAIILQ